MFYQTVPPENDLDSLLCSLVYFLHPDRKTSAVCQEISFRKALEERHAHLFFGGEERFVVRF